MTQLTVITDTPMMRYPLQEVERRISQIKGVPYFINIIERNMHDDTLESMLEKLDPNANAIVVISNDRPEWCDKLNATHKNMSHTLYDLINDLVGKVCHS